LQTNRFVRFEFSTEGFLERLNSLVDRQHFCEKEEDAADHKQEKKGRHNILHTWLRLSAMKVFLGSENTSCSDTCTANGETALTVQTSTLVLINQCYSCILS